MTVTQMLAFNQMRKSGGIAYLLFFFLGGLGVHRFYLRQMWMGIAWLVMTISTLAIPGLFILFGFAALIELCVLHASVSAYNDKVLKDLEESNEN